MKVWRVDNYNDYFSNIVKVPEKEFKSKIADNEKKLFYSEYINKTKKNGLRKIYCVTENSDLYKIQKNIKNNFLDNIMLSDSSYGFRKGRSYYDFLASHKSFYSGKYFLRLDIRDFFGSIEYSLIEDVVSYYFVVGENLTSSQKKELLQNTLSSMTYENKVPQGAITSPTLSNIVFRQLDLRIEKFCQNVDAIYTRYADDLLFSSYNRNLHSAKFINFIRSILISKGFHINHSKTIRTKNLISLNGFVISENDIHLSRKKLASLSRILFCLETPKWINSKASFVNLNMKLKTEGDKHLFEGKYALLNFLAGFRAFIIPIVRSMDDSKLRKKQQKYIVRIEKTIEKIEKLPPKK
ncbi:RNA-directed DNA polymerase [bacterium AH-315-K05]|nr:RNA-directed DNA polymerase [bacterium AH-315-K05]